MPDDKKSSTDKLDDAMKELLDICQLYTDKYNDKISQRIQEATDNNAADSGSASINFNQFHGRRDFPRLNPLFDDKIHQHREHTTPTTTTVTQCDNKMAFKTINNEATRIANRSPIDRDRCSKATQFVDDGSIDRLQQKQSELQAQLDDVLEIAKNLDLKRTRKLSILNEEDIDDKVPEMTNSKSSYGDDDDEKEDVELIEFRQIENELRISELNRQLSNIQEQLRLKLFRRLSSRTSNDSSKSSTKDHRKTPPTAHKQRESFKRNDSAQTDESTPSTSSCSDEATASSSISTSNMTHSSLKDSIEIELANQFEKCNLSTKQTDIFALLQPQQSTGDKGSDHIDNPSLPNHVKTDPERMSNVKGAQGAEQEDLELAFDQSHNYEVLIPTCMYPQQHSKFLPLTPGRNDIYTNAMSGDIKNQAHQTNGLDPEQGRNHHHNAFNGLRSCPASNDLERIEEGEEDDGDYYCGSDKLRMVYEEKISPIMQAAGVNGLGPYPTEQKAQNMPSASKQPSEPQAASQNANFFKESDYSSPRVVKDRRFNPENVNSAKRGNRPLTIYLPKPDAEIDLIETVQALGHDLDILSNDLQFTPSTARGYLYKSCSNNSKKWLKRFFYFDRQSKTLSYYENEEQLVKKTNSPNSRIPFDEIGDVYVDHRMNELNEKQRGSKRKGYVFVLATSKRKYLLASPKPEAMRAWIDVLFTAAKANDYFQQVGNDDESLSFQYDSLAGE